ncbi:unnamed protein product, partial [Ascophyllum nodosum]
PASGDTPHLQLGKARIQQITTDNIGVMDLPGFVATNLMYTIMGSTETLSWRYTDLVDSQDSSLDDLRDRSLCLGGGIQAIMLDRPDGSGERSISVSRQRLEDTERVWSKSLMALTSWRWLTDCVTHIVLTQAIVLTLSFMAQGYVVVIPLVTLCLLYVIYLMWGSRWRLVLNGRHEHVRKVLRGDSLRKGFLMMGALIGAWDQAVVTAAFAVICFPDVQKARISGSPDSPTITMSLSGNREIVSSYGPRGVTDMHG